jgi:APA family basic amino acid/polyamine antiporter
VLRRTRPDWPRAYRTPGYPLVPILFVLAMLALLANSLREHPEVTLGTIGVVAAGVPLYHYWRRKHARG